MLHMQQYGCIINEMKWNEIFQALYHFKSCYCVQSVCKQSLSHIISLKCYVRYTLKQCFCRESMWKVFLQEKDSKDTGVINLVCVHVWAHMHTNAHTCSMKTDWIKNTICLNIQTFSLDVQHVPYAGDSGFQVSNLLYFPSRTS